MRYSCKTCLYSYKTLLQKLECESSELDRALTSSLNDKAALQLLVDEHKAMHDASGQQRAKTDRLADELGVVRERCEQYAKEVCFCMSAGDSVFSHLPVFRRFFEMGNF